MVFIVVRQETGVGFMPALGITSLVFYNLPDMIQNVVVIMVTRAVCHSLITRFRELTVSSENPASEVCR